MLFTCSALFVRLLILVLLFLCMFALIYSFGFIAILLVAVLDSFVGVGVVVVILCCCYCCQLSSEHASSSFG